MCNQPKEGDLRVWWVPQMPMDAFYVPVQTPDEAIVIADTLARYDAFQYENNIKPDYSNVGGLEVFEDGDWCDWCDEDGFDFDEWIADQEEEQDE